MPKLKWITVAVFVILTIVGFRLALYKPLWNDEIYTQLASIGHRSFFQLIFEGPGSAEANNSPLFYLIQKAIVQIAGYHTPEAWVQTHWEYEDIPSRLILRIQPVVLMSLALAFIFYFLARQIWWSGFIGLALSLSSYMVWLYWAEARPYALWFLLTTLQIFIFFEIGREPSRRRWIQLAVIHGLLALTTIFSFGQIAAVTFILVSSRRILRWEKFIAVGLIPFILCFYFYFKIARGPFSYWVEGGVQDFLVPCFSWERLALIGALGMLFVLQEWLQRQQRYTSVVPEKKDTVTGPVLAMTVLWWVAAVILLELFKINSTSPQEGNPISTRYFIFLTPVSIIATAVMIREFFFRIRPYAWLTVNGWIVLIGILILDFLNNGYWVITLW